MLSLAKVLSDMKLKKPNTVTNWCSDAMGSFKHVLMHMDSKIESNMDKDHKGERGEKTREATANLPLIF